MTFYESNREVRPTGEEPGEFAADVPDDDEVVSEDPTRRPTGSPPLAPEGSKEDAEG